jgi:branched-chain amino acid transport system ATP-binding protein
MTKLLETRGLRAGYGRLTVLFDVDFAISRGEFVAVVGPNGAGKSTLLKALLGVVPARRGVIGFERQRITHEGATSRFARGIALVPEGRRIFKNLSVAENLSAGAYGVADDVLERQRERCFRLFPRLEERHAQRAGSLSGGEQQMLAVSRALMSNPKLLLVDELSMGLAPLVVADLLNALEALQEDGLAVVVVDQHAVKLLERANRAYVMEKGRVRMSGDAASVAAHLDNDDLAGTVEPAAVLAAG